MVKYSSLTIACVSALVLTACFGPRIDKTQNLWPYFELARKKGLAAPKTRAMTETEIAQLPQSALERLIASVQPAPRNTSAYLFAVGVQDYLYLPDVDYTDTSLQAVTSALGVAFGIPVRNRTVISGPRATTGYVASELDALLAQLEPQDRLYFYFAGHSLTDADGRNVHLLLRDAQAKAYDASSLTLADLMATMETSQVGRVWAFMETSFAGRTDLNSLRPGGAVGGIGLRTLYETLPGKVSVFQAADANQFANGYKDRGHRLFSYYLAEGLALGIADADDLNSHVSEAVTRLSRSQGRSFEQTPELYGWAGNLAR